MLICPQCNRTENQVEFTWGNRVIEVLMPANDGGPAWTEKHRICDDCEDPTLRPHPTCCEVGMRRIIKREGRWRIDPLPEPIDICPWCRATLPI